MEGTCNKCVFPLNKEESPGICPTDSSLTYAASKGKLSCVKELIAAGVDVNTGCECHGNGPLLSAAMGGHNACLRELINSGADVNIQNKKGRTCLMFVEDEQCCKELISAGADVNITDSEGGTSLLYAILNGNARIVELLITSGADVNIQSKLKNEDDIVLMADALGGNVECLTQLIKSGTLAAAVEQEHIDFVTEHEVDINKEIFHEVQQMDLSCVKELIAAGGDVNAACECHGVLPLMLVAFVGHVDYAKMLIDAGADVNTLDMIEASPLMLSAARGHVDCGIELINAGADVNIKDKFQQTAITLAAAQGNVAFVKMLISKGAQVNIENIDDSSPDNYDVITNAFSMKAARIKETEKMASDAGVDLTTVMSAEQKRNADFIKMVCSPGADIRSFISALGIDLPNSVKQLLDTEADVNIWNERLNTTHILATEKRNLDILKIIYDCSRLRFSPLMFAALRGQVDCATELIDAGADVNYRNKIQNTALPLAVMIENLDLVKKLIAAGANVNCGNINGFSALMISAHLGYVQCLKELLAAGADVNMQAEDGHTATSIAFRYRRVDCIKELIIAGAGKNIKNDEALQRFSTGSVEFVTKLLKAGIDVNSTDESGNTALMIAVKNSNREIVQLLIDRGAKVNAENDNGETALYLAVVQGHLAFERQQGKEENEVSWLIVQLLLVAGAHLNKTKNGLNLNTLHLESEKLSKPDPQILKMLYAAGGDIFDDGGIIPSVKPLQDYARDIIRKILKENNVDENLYSTVLRLELPPKLKSYLLHHTLRNYNVILNTDEKNLLLKTIERDIENVEHLIALNVDLNVQDENGMTSLMIASQDGNLELVEQFIKGGADLNIQAMFGDTALIFATRKKQHECVKKLLKHGANTNYHGKNGDTALIHAAKERCEDILYTLLKSGANPNITNDNGCTALMFGASRLKCVKVLIKAGSNVNWMDKDGQTALHYAAAFGEVDCVKKLIASGTEINGRANITPLMIAAVNGHVDCLNVLIREGADLNIKIFGITATTFAAAFGSACFKTLVDAGGEVMKGKLSGSGKFILVWCLTYLIFPSLLLFCYQFR